MIIRSHPSIWENTPSDLTSVLIVASIDSILKWNYPEILSSSFPSELITFTDISWNAFTFIYFEQGIHSFLLLRLQGKIMKGWTLLISWVNSSKSLIGRATWKRVLQVIWSMRNEHILSRVLNCIASYQNLYRDIIYAYKHTIKTMLMHSLGYAELCI